jgi:hypothetical protein
MSEIKRITKDGYTLIHDWYYDDFGLKKNGFDLYHEETRTHRPFLGDPRVIKDSTSVPFLGDDISPYTDEEYLDMLERQVKRIQENDKE